MSFRRWNLALLCVPLLAAVPARAQSALPPQIEAPILLRILAYDRSVERRPGDDLVVAILYDLASGTSNHARAGIARAFRGAPVQAIGGKNLKFLEVNVAGGDLTTTFRQESVAVAYVTEGMDSRLPAVVDAAQATQVTTLGGSMRYARRGVAVVVDTLAGRPQIYVNLTSARASGADLTAALLKLATVIK